MKQISVKYLPILRKYFPSEEIGYYIDKDTLSFIEKPPMLIDMGKEYEEYSADGDSETDYDTIEIKSVKVVQRMIKLS